MEAIAAGSLLDGESIFKPQRPSITSGARYSPYGGRAGTVAAQMATDEAAADQAMLDKLLAGVDPGNPAAAAGAGEICQFFAKAGWCKWGDSCKYRHERPDGEAAATAELCQFFSKAGWCQWGDQCKYIHALPTAAVAGQPIAPPATPGLPSLGGKGPPSIVCEFFAKTGWCKWGDGCRYIHAGTPRPAPIAAGLPPQPRTLLTGSPSVCKYFAQPGGCKNGEFCTFAHVGLPGEPEVCQFFQKTGWCKWNELCKYVHAGGPEVPIPKAQPGEACQFFQKAGWCKWGDSCRYSHEGGPPAGEVRGPPGPQPPGSVNELCQFFAKTGWCRWGDSCKYIHAEAPVQPQHLQELPSDDPLGDLLGDLLGEAAADATGSLLL